jgi:hypothetical protein
MHHTLQTAVHIASPAASWRTVLRGAAACGLLVTLCRAAAAQPAAPQAAHPLVRVFLDCNRCDEDYLRREVTFVTYVRDREDADVHVLVTTQRNGGGGVQFRIAFIGVGRFEGDDQSLVYDSPQTATDDERRAGFANVFRLGLVRYAADSSIANRLHVTFGKAPGAGPAAPARADPWNFWIYRVGASGDFEGEETSSRQSVRGSFSANRTTDDWRLTFEASGRYRDETFVVDEDDGTTSTIFSVNRTLDAGSTIVKSLSQHWSIGLLGRAGADTYRNYALRTRVAPGIEYNVFPYADSSRRMFLLQYTIGYRYERYNAVTVYGKTRDQLLDHRLEAGISLRRPWGSVTAETNLSQYLNDPSKYSLGMFGGASVRVFKGFSVDVFGEYSRTRDQIYLPLGEASTAEILLRQRQLATGYEYGLNFGISYSFGSIFNNVVNPRFGGVDFDS